MADARRIALAGAAVLLGLLTHGVAQAACVTQPVMFNLPENQSFTTDKTVSGGGCETGFGTGIDGRGAAQTTYSEVHVVERPKHMNVTPLSNGFGYALKVKDNYRGSDRYTMRACGSSIYGKGCVTITYIVTIQ